MKRCNNDSGNNNYLTDPLKSPDGVKFPRHKVNPLLRARACGHKRERESLCAPGKINVWKMSNNFCECAWNRSAIYSAKLI